MSRVVWPLRAGRQTALSGTEMIQVRQSNAFVGSMQQQQCAEQLHVSQMQQLVSSSSSAEEGTLRGQVGNEGRMTMKRTEPKRNGAMVIGVILIAVHRCARALGAVACRRRCQDDVGACAACTCSVLELR